MTTHIYKVFLAAVAVAAFTLISTAVVQQARAVDANVLKLCRDGEDPMAG